MMTTQISWWLTTTQSAHCDKLNVPINQSGEGQLLACF
jgi:hypothetical protein